MATSKITGGEKIYPELWRMLVDAARDSKTPTLLTVKPEGDYYVETFSEVCEETFLKARSYIAADLLQLVPWGTCSGRRNGAKKSVAVTIYCDENGRLKDPPLPTNLYATVLSWRMERGIEDVDTPFTDTEMLRGSVIFMIGFEDD